MTFRRGFRLLTGCIYTVVGVTAVIFGAADIFNWFLYMGIALFGLTAGPFAVIDELVNGR